MVLKFSRIPGNLEKRLLFALNSYILILKSPYFCLLAKKTCLIKDHNSDLYFLIENGCPQMYG